MPPDTWVGLFVERSGTGFKIGKIYQFTVLVGTTLSFLNDSEGGRPPTRVNTLGGELPAPLPTGSLVLWDRPLDCETIRAGGVAMLEDVGGGSKPLKEFLASPEGRIEPGPTLAERFPEGLGSSSAGSRTGTPESSTTRSDHPRLPAPPKGFLERLGSVFTPKPPEPGLKDVFAGSSGTPPAQPKPGERLGAVVAAPLDAPTSGLTGPAEPPKAPAVTTDPDNRSPNVALAKPPPAPRAAVCDAALQPLQVLSGLKLTSLQTVGRRNNNLEVEGFDYDGASGHTFPLRIKYDIAYSARKLTPYVAVSPRRAASDWVAIHGLDETRAKRPPPAPAKPSRPLRLIIVSGAAELAISGLDLVDAELSKQSGGPVPLEIDWHLTEQSGLIKAPDLYTSLTQLVKAASEKAAERPLDVLTEAQLRILFDDFQKIMDGQTRPVDKIFWIKGAYQIPSSIPRRFEDFITTVSSSKAFVQAPSGRVGKWLVVVTARMPGFSVNYLKEPVYSHQVGDVLEESEAPSVPRRLIGDTSLLATRLRISLASIPTVQPAKDEASNTAAGRLVIDANDVFVERGYVLSLDAAVALQNHLKRILTQLDGPPLPADGLKELAEKAGKPSPTILDILQNVDDAAYPRLPRSLPDWAHKPIKDFNTSDAENARTFIVRYAEGAEKLSAAIAGGHADPPACDLFYASEEFLGFKP